MASRKHPLITRQEATALVSCLVNLLLTVAKFILFYMLVKSVSLKAEAWHSLSDIGSSFVVYLALLLGRRHVERAAAPDEPKPAEPEPKSSGLFSEPEPTEERADVEAEEAPAYRAKPEDIVAVGIACLFIVVCIGIFIDIFRPMEIETNYTLPVAAGMCVMAYASYLLYKFEYHVGVESDSPGLIADGYHSKIDMYGSLLVVVALLGHELRLEVADQIIAVVICLGILAHAVQVLAMAARHYLGRPVEREPHAHGSALADVYALSGKWGERLSRAFTAALACVFFIDRSGPDLPRRVGRRLALIVILAVVMFYVLSGLFVCGPEEQAFVERFGRPTTDRPYGPGLHYRWPWPVDRVVKARVRKIRTFYLGTSAYRPDQPILWTNKHFKSEFPFLTGNENFLTTFIAVHYRINDLRKYLYECALPVGLPERPGVLAAACQAKMRELVGTSRFFDCLTTKRRTLEKEVRAYLSKEMGQFGIEVLAVAIRDMHPPLDVAPSFEAVISAMEEKQAMINEAKAYAAAEPRLAEGRAAEIEADADAYSKRVAEEAAAEVSAFVALQEQYALAKKVTAARMYLEMMEESIAETVKWAVLSGGRASPFVLWFPAKEGGYWQWHVAPGDQGDVQK